MSITRPHPGVWYNRMEVVRACERTGVDYRQLPFGELAPEFVDGEVYYRRSIVDTAIKMIKEKRKVPDSALVSSCEILLSLAKSSPVNDESMRSQLNSISKMLDGEAIDVALNEARRKIYGGQ